MFVLASWHLLHTSHYVQEGTLPPSPFSYELLHVSMQIRLYHGASKDRGTLTASTYLGVLPDGIVVTLEVVIIRDVFPYLTVLDRIEGTTRNTFKV